MARLVSLDGIDVEVPASAFATMHAVVRDMAQGLTITQRQSSYWPRRSALESALERSTLHCCMKTTLAF